MKKALIFILVLVLASCSNKNKELMCYSLGWMEDNLLNKPYHVEYDQKKLYIRDGNDTIFYCKIDSVSKENVYINDHNVKFVDRELYYTKKGKFVKDNKVLTVIYQEIYATDSLGNSNDSPIGYVFDNRNPEESRSTFNCINKVSIEDYNELIKFKQQKNK